jgi:hypothetical protein
VLLETTLFEMGVKNLLNMTSQKIRTLEGYCLKSEPGNKYIPRLMSGRDGNSHYGTKGMGRRNWGFHGDSQGEAIGNGLSVVVYGLC